MLGQRSAQLGLFEADTLYGDFVGTRTFYGYLASQRSELFRDEDFTALYFPNNGRPSVPPSLLATALVLQTYDNVSDDKAKQRADYDLRWKVALGIELETRPFAKKHAAGVPHAVDHPRSDTRHLSAQPGARQAPRGVEERSPAA